MAFVDLTKEPQDFLSPLPSELIHLICEYLFPTHEPDKAFLPPDHAAGKKARPCSHALDCLAAANRRLRSEVNEWALHFLLEHQDITHYKQPKQFQRGASRNLLRRGRPGLLTWSERYCVFCGKKSARSAILMNGLRCCTECDMREWPDKITKTSARKWADLSDEHLLPPHFLSPTCSHLVRQHVKPRYGTYICAGVPTTMFLRSDVEDLARRLYGADITFPYKHPRYASTSTKNSEVSSAQKMKAQLLHKKYRVEDRTDVSSAARCSTPPLQAFGVEVPVAIARQDRSQAETVVQRQTATSEDDSSTNQQVFAVRPDEIEQSDLSELFGLRMSKRFKGIE